MSTPFGRMPGVELHAQAVEGLLNGRRLRRSPPMVDALATLLAGLLVTVWVGWKRLSLAPRIAGLLLLVALWGGGAVAALAWAWWVPVVGPYAAAGLVLPVTLAAWWRREGRQRARLRETFSHYLNDALIEVLVREPERVRLGGERRVLTVLFSDIRDFTHLSERLEPEVLVERLNTYLTPMTRAVLDHGGYLDKYIGDAVMAVYGAPVETEAHADRALETALAMLRALESVRRTPAWAGAALRIGIGINTGPMAVGNMGSEERFDYTVVGDAVNLASRLEGLCKTYRCQVLVGEATVAAAQGSFVFREIDRVQVKGKEAPVAVYELRTAPAAAMERWDAGLSALRAGAFAQARAEFEAFLTANPDDGPAAVHLERLEALGGVAPPGWTGVYTQLSK
ncbi:MAG: CHASE2 domain-containing protein [Deltaproteobacteria bacterium]|nr:MAG: CHASE2 domain-containing protein [Deltaproteobacteria bacterium]